MGDQGFAVGRECAICCERGLLTLVVLAVRVETPKAPTSFDTLDQASGWVRERAYFFMRSLISSASLEDFSSSSGGCSAGRSGAGTGSCVSGVCSDIRIF